MLFETVFSNDAEPVAVSSLGACMHLQYGSDSSKPSLVILRRDAPHSDLRSLT